MNDEELLDHLARLFDRHDPTPETLAARVRTALTLRTDAVPTRLLTDSAHVTGMRGARTTRTLRFADLDVVLEPAAGGLHVTGLARTGTRVITRWPTGAHTTRVGAEGWFHVDRVPTGPLKFLLRGDGGPDVATRWFVA